MEKKFSVGDLVISTAGRDKGIAFLIVNQENEFVFLVNGKERKTTNPKKKKIKHVASYGQTSLKIQEKLKNGGFVTNPDVKRALAEIIKS